MPIYNFICPGCEVTHRKLLTPEEAEKSWACVVCGFDLVRNPNPPSMAVKETVDNGIMTKKVEIYKDNTEVYKERNEKNYRDPDAEKP
jgi:hypothetical protein